jgi:hypothetical protein
MALALASPGLVHRDQFNRADGAPGAAYDNASGTWSITSNKLAFGAGTPLIRVAGVDEPDLVVQVIRPLNHNTNYAGLRLRRSASGNSFLMFDIGNDSGGQRCRIYRWNGAAFVLVAVSADIDTVSYPGAWHWKVVLEGTTARFYLDGVLMCSGPVPAASATPGDNQVWLGGTTPVAGDYDELVIAVPSNTVSLSGLPGGWKVRAGGVTAAESGGTAAADVAGAAFPLALVEMLDGANVVQDTYAGETWGGDVYEPGVPEAPTVTVSSIGKRSATGTGSAFASAGAGAHALTRVRVRDTADDSIVFGPEEFEVDLTGPLAAAPLPFMTGGLVLEMEYEDELGQASGWGTSAEFATLGWDDGTEELIFYEAPEAPGGPEDTEWASCSSSLDHARPYLMKPEGYGGAEIDLLKGTASVGQQNLAVLDKRSDPDDQGSGWFTAKLADSTGETALIGRRSLRRRWLALGAPEEVGGEWTWGSWVTVLDGVVAGVEQMDSRVAYRVILKDIRERERKTRVFYRTGTAMVFPRGVVGGYGRLADGSWLVPPVTAWPGTFKRSTSTIGQVLLDGADVGDPDARLVQTEAMAEAVRPAWDDELEVLVADRVTVLWRPEGSGGAFTALERMQMPERELWQHHLKPQVLDADAVRPTMKTLFARLANTEIVTAVRMCGAAIPAHNQRVEVMVRYDGPASETYPFHYDGTFGELLRNLYRGDYSTDEAGNPVAPGIRFDAAAVLALDVPCRMRVTEPSDNLKEWVEKNIYQPLGAAPAIVDGLITPVRYEIPAVDVDLPVLTRDNCLRGPTPWSHSGSDAINTVIFTYYRDEYLGSEGDPQGKQTAGDGIASRAVPITIDDEFSSGLLNVKKLEIKPTTLRSLAGAHGTLLTGDVMDEVPAQLARDRGRQALDSFRLGGQHSGATMLESEAAALGVRAGSAVLVRLPSLPDYRTGRRMLAADGVNVTERLARVVVHERPNAGVRELKLVDLGAANQPALAPTLGPPSADADGVVSVPVTAVPAGSTAAVEFAVATLAPATDSGAWVPLGRTEAPATLTSPAQPAGVTVWVRARGVAARQRPSLYTVPVSIVVPSTPRLRDVLVRFADEGTATVYFTPNAYALAVRVEYLIQDPAGVELVAGTFDGSTASGMIVIPDMVPADYVLVADVTGWSGWSGSAATGTAGETLRVTRRRVLGPWIFSLNLAQVGSLLVATWEINEHVGYVEVWGKEGSSPVVAGVADDAYGKGEYQPAEAEASWSVRDGTHYVTVRAFGAQDSADFAEASDTILITGTGGDPGEPPEDIPGTPLITPDNVANEVAIHLVHTRTDLDVEVRLRLDFAAVGAPILLAPGTTDHDEPIASPPHWVEAQARYTLGAGLEGMWTVWSRPTRVT